MFVFCICLFLCFVPQTKKIKLLRHVLHLALDPAPQRTAAVAVLSPATLLPTDGDDKNIAAPLTFLHF